MGRRSRAVELVLGEVIERSVRPSGTSDAVASVERAASTAAAPEESVVALSRDDDDVAKGLEKCAAVNSEHPQFEASQAVMHGIRSFTLPLSSNDIHVSGDLDSSSDHIVAEDGTSVTASVSIGRLPSSITFKPDGLLNLQHFREAVTQRHEVRYRVSKKGVPVGKPELSIQPNDIADPAKESPASASTVPADASATDDVTKLSVDGDKKQSKSIKFAFKTYAGAAFASIRASMGIPAEAFVKSLAGGEAFLDFVSNSKSGQFFFFTTDGNYMIKTMSQQESLWFRDFLPDYFQHLKDHPQSLLVRIVGLYRLHCAGHRKLHFMVMRNVFDSVLPIDTKYDLKGSTLGRRASSAEPVLKDLDIENRPSKIRLGVCRDLFISQIKSDSDFLSRNGLMDYSLLVGIYVREKDPSAPTNETLLKRMGYSSMADATTPRAYDPRGLVFLDELGQISEVYLVGIIDYLQKYNWKKKTENFFKSIRHGGSSISAISPPAYAERFLRFIANHIDA